MITFIRSHSGSSRSYFAYMAAGRASVSASREQVASRRPTRAPFFNEKEYFYRARVLRRARKVAATAGRQQHRETVMTSVEAAALVSRCYQAEWSAAVAHYNVAQLHQRLNQLEAAVAENIPPLPLPGVAGRGSGSPTRAFSGPRASAAPCGGLCTVASSLLLADDPCSRLIV